MRRPQKRLRLPLFVLTKREKFLISTALSTIGLLATQLVPFDMRHEMVIGLSVVSLIASAWALREDMHGVEWFTLLVLPTLYTAAVALFYFLLPVRWLTRLPTIIVYAVGMYALLLTENIFNVAAQRSIQLVRAGQSIGMLITLVTAFLFFNTLLAFHFPSYINSAVAALIAFPLALQSLWSVSLESHSISKTVWQYTLCTVLVIAQVMFVLSFWPVRGNIAALFMTSLLYSFVGMGQQRLLERMFSNILRELIGVVVVVLILMFTVTRWG